MSRVPSHVPSKCAGVEEERFIHVSLRGGEAGGLTREPQLWGRMVSLGISPHLSAAPFDAFETTS